MMATIKMEEPSRKNSRLMADILDSCQAAVDTEGVFTMSAISLLCFRLGSTFLMLARLQLTHLTISFDLGPAIQPWWAG